MEENEGILELGGSIRLSGFSELDGGQMAVLKKIVGNYAKKMSEICEKFEGLSLTMKPVHKTENSALYEIHAKCIDGGRPIPSEVTDRNMFIAIDSALKKVVNEIQK